MSSPHLFLIRGLPGSGKSTLADVLAASNSAVSRPVFEADHFFLTDKGYQFNPDKLAEAHKECQRKTWESLQEGQSCIVANTFSHHWELLPYFKLAKQTGAGLTVIDLFDGGCTNSELAKRCIHKVPVPAILAMRNRWEHGSYRSQP